MEAATLLLGVDVEQVLEVLAPQELTRVPLAPAAVAGLVNLRGLVVPAVDLRRRLGVAAGEAGSAMHIVVRTGTGPVSLLVDEIGDVVELDEDALVPAPPMLPGSVRRLTRGVFAGTGSPLLLLLDVDRALSI